MSGPRRPDPPGPPRRHRHQGPPPPRRPGGGPPPVDPDQRTADAAPWWQQIPKGRPTPPHLAYRPRPQRPPRPFGPPPAGVRPPAPPPGMRPSDPPPGMRPPAAPVPQPAPPPHWQPPASSAAHATSHRPLLIAAAVAGGLVLAVVITLGARGVALPGAPELDVDQAQAGVLAVLTDPIDGYGRDDVTAVRCNDGRNPTVRKGATFTCSVQVGGAGRQVTVLFPDNTGTYEVDRPR
ncbi:MAG TPA: DUF4333 domain-containing protein [Mycobacterium sp.]|nr:DUF4333 domain-containing protein [Mycobacterium sp.]